jgi:hypothetical protein
MTDGRNGEPIATVSGGRIHPLDPRPEEIRVRDIAHGLAHTCRYAGQCQFYYSVATHARYVSQDLAAGFGPEVQLYGLFHDAAEAYVTDVPRPVKRELEGYDPIEERILAAVWASLGVSPPTDEQWTAVMEADDRLFHHEAETLLADFDPPETDLSYDLSPCAPEQAREAFLTRAERLLAETTERQA